MAPPEARDSRYRGSLARRLIIVFALATVVPVLIASGIAYSQLMRSVASHQQQSLREQAKSAGMNLLGQLQLVRATLALPAPDSGIRLLDGGLGRIEYEDAVVLYNPGTRLPGLGDAQMRRLLAGEPVLHWRRDASGAVQWQMLQLQAGMRTLARAHLDTGRLLTVAAASGTDTTIAVESTADDGMMLVHDADVASAAAGRWQHESWVLPLEVEFSASPVRVVIGAPLSGAARGFEAMKLAIPLLLAGALALAVWLATAQLRRYLGPLDVLTAAARRIADRDFDVSVNIDTGDEFALLGQDFNAMAANLRRQFSTLESVAEVDRLLLRAPGLETILDALLPRIASVLGAERVSVLLVDAESRQYARAYDFPGEAGLHQLRRISIGSGGLPVVDAPRPATDRATAELASAVFGPVDPGQVRLLPLGTGRDATGLLCLCWANRESAQGCDASIVAGFADRLSVALANLTHEQMLIHQARYDALTGLVNRESLAGILREQIDKAATRTSHAALLYIDLDEFKNINDSAGHEAGDCVLVEIAARLRRCTGAGDTVARLGGDEFAIAVAGNGDPDHAADLAERVRRELRRPVTVSGLERRMSASIGMARIPEDGESVDVLLRNADIAMYQAKERGRNQAVAFAPGMLRQMTDRVMLEMDLQRALENDELEMHYQPIVRTDGSIAAEALLRWGRRDGRIVNPAEFIAIAEQSDLILDIGSRVIDRVCRDLAGWRAQGLAPQYVSINVSPRQLHSDDFLPALLDNLGAHGLSPRHIQLEITESSIADGERVSEVIDNLAQHGFSIAIDDFGTGYSSLSHLHRYPFSVVKIDRSFVLGIPRSRVAIQLAGTIIRMAHGLDKLVIAEGVETLEQRQALLEFGCDAMQGFLFGRAAPASDFARLLREHQNSRAARLPVATARKTA